jgi:hypothetical protein
MVRKLEQLGQLAPRRGTGGERQFNAEDVDLVAGRCLSTGRALPTVRYESISRPASLGLLEPLERLLILAGDKGVLV